MFQSTAYHIVEIKAQNERYRIAAAGLEYESEDTPDLTSGDKFPVKIQHTAGKTAHQKVSDKNDGLTAAYHDHQILYGIPPEASFQFVKNSQCTTSLLVIDYNTLYILCVKPTT